MDACLHDKNSNLWGDITSISAKLYSQITHTYDQCVWLSSQFQLAGTPLLNESIVGAEVHMLWSLCYKKKKSEETRGSVAQNPKGYKKYGTRRYDEMRSTCMSAWLQVWAPRVSLTFKNHIFLDDGYKRSVHIFSTCHGNKHNTCTNGLEIGLSACSS